MNVCVRVFCAFFPQKIRCVGCTTSTIFYYYGLFSDGEKQLLLCTYNSKSPQIDLVVVAGWWSRGRVTVKAFAYAWGVRAGFSV